jgi:hypothetical protein
MTRRPSVMRLIRSGVLVMCFAVLPSAVFAQSPNCLSAVPNDGTADDAEINACLSQGGTVVLEAGVYWIASGLEMAVNGTVFTGAGGDDSSGSTGTVLAAVNGMYGQMLIITADDSEFSHIYMNGRVANRTLQYTCDQAFGGYRDYGYNAQVIADGFEVHHVTIADAMCGSGMEVQGADFVIRDSYFGGNGIPEDGSYSGDLPWADGLTLHLCDGGQVYDNAFADNTDIDVVVGGHNGGSPCTIEYNLIANWFKHAFAGLHVGFYGNTGGNGDHSGSSYSYNEIIGYSNKMAFGIIVGFHPWGSTVDVGDAGTIEYNDIFGGVIGLAIDGIDDGYIHNNTMTNQGGSYGYGCSATDDYTAYHTGSASIQSGGTSRWFHNASCGT